MQRITSKLHDFAPVLYVNKEGKHLTPAQLSVGQTREVLQRLCEYEETGLSPDEILELKKSADTKTKGIKIRFAYQWEKVLSPRFGTLPYRRNCNCNYL